MPFCSLLFALCSLLFALCSLLFALCSLLSIKSLRPKYGKPSKRKHIKKRDQSNNWSRFLYRLTKTRMLRQQAWYLHLLPRSWRYHPEPTLQPHPAIPQPHQ
ncbi:hypothetical protein DUD43_12965 [Alcaligenes faecalis]|nr:hypothetical protein DUD43_12965 [Alcaligenes faecalis]